MSGYEVLRSLRVAKVKTPILILSGMAGIEDKVKGLGFGADDYLTKPFHKDELVARIQRVLRRTAGGRPNVTLDDGDVEIDLARKRLVTPGGSHALTPVETRLLQLLIASLE